MRASTVVKKIPLIALAVFSLYSVVSVVYNTIFRVSARWLQAPDIVAYSRLYITRIDPIDMTLLVRGIRSKPTFLSTFAWWHQDWAGIVPFWRPLTSQFFWLEYRFFGFDHLDKWQWVGIASHLLMVALLALYALRVGPNRWIAPLAVLFFAGSETLGPADWLLPLMGARVTPCDIALDSWKNQPEAWVGICTIGAILAALSGRWARSLACAAAGISFKESGWYIFLLVPIALWGAGRLKTIPLKVYAAGALVAAAFILLRASAGPAVFRGYHQYTEHSGLARYLIAAQGFYVALLRSPSAASAIVAACLLALLLWSRASDWLRLGLGIASIAACVLLDAKLQLTTPAAAAAQYLEWDLELGNAVLAFFWLALAWVLLTSPTYRRIGVALVGMVLVSAISMALASQVVRHVLYIEHAFQSLLMAVVAAAAAERAAFWWKRLKKPAAAQTSSCMPVPASAASER